nr:MAG TPA: hypothetical protein [Caudoviricetes sp.]
MRSCDEHGRAGIDNISLHCYNKNELRSRT